MQVDFDPNVVSYEDLVKVYFENHDPTTPNRQGPNRGSQYRSVIFYHNDKQREIAESIKKQIDSSHYFKDPVVTEILPASTFYRAEEYHQNYYKNHKPYF